MIQLNECNFSYEGKGTDLSDLSVESPATKTEEINYEMTNIDLSGQYAYEVNETVEPNLDLFSNMTEVETVAPEFSYTTNVPEFTDNQVVIEPTIPIDYVPPSTEIEYSTTENKIQLDLSVGVKI